MDLEDQLANVPEKDDYSSHHSGDNEDLEKWQKKAEKRKSDKRKLKEKVEDLEKSNVVLEGRIKELQETKKELSNHNAELKYLLDRKG